MEQFNPVLNIVAVDESDVVVTFDFGSTNDEGRAPKALRIGRKFTEFSMTVTSFEALGQDETGERKEYRGVVKLVIKPVDGEIEEYVLAEPRLWLHAESRNRKKGSQLYNYHSADVVTRAVRNGVADAVSRALAGFYGKEGQVDTLMRAPGLSGGGSESVTMSESRKIPNGLTNAVQSLIAPVVAANDEQGEKKRFRRNVIAAAIATPLIVFSLLSLGGALKKNDPIQDAVAKAMAHDSRSTQAQVELTKETLKQMGLDPGKSGDIGCLAPQ